MEQDEFQNLWRQAQPEAGPTPALPPLGPSSAPSLSRILRPLKRTKWIGVGIGLVWVGLVDLLLYYCWPIATPFFLVSIGGQVLISKLMIGIYLYQLALVRRVDVGQSIVAVQRRLARVRLTSLWVLRIGFLQLPLWATFFWSERLFRESSQLQRLALLGPALLLALLAGWLFVNIRYSNRHRRWFRALFGGSEWAPLMQAMQLLEQLEEDYRPEPPAQPQRP
ncbi:hypothetical protein [Hymenobacter jeollabukensis]|uniref:Uncharacterized protein n=1 Tax=Hymenobacter jeollabukensis TaxID=2025313 RepID=A0A5R8WN26_9BACT|nr:hypothetical protein [Hymenobacter jeollabukensis]TLM91114.1 hypothetical protein FDY95_16085 [Hymenobacter jeollabukensis]